MVRGSAVAVLLSVLVAAMAMAVHNPIRLETMEEHLVPPSLLIMRRATSTRSLPRMAEIVRQGPPATWPRATM